MSEKISNYRNVRKYNIRDEYDLEYNTLEFNSHDNRRKGISKLSMINGCISHSYIFRGMHLHTLEDRSRPSRSFFSKFGIWSNSDFRLLS